MHPLALQDTSIQVEILDSFIPICAACKKIREVNGSWRQIEAKRLAQAEHELRLTHSLCPDCVQRLYPEFFGSLS